MTYSEKLQDVRWQRKRLEIFERDGFTCTECGTKTGSMHVHHQKYIGEPWDCPNEFLKTICSICHKKEHSVIPVAPRIEIPFPINQVYFLSKNWHIPDNSKPNNKSGLYKKIKSMEYERDLVQEKLKEQLSDEDLINTLTQIQKMNTDISNLRKEIYG